MFKKIIASVKAANNPRPKQTGIKQALQYQNYVQKVVRNGK